MVRFWAYYAALLCFFTHVWSKGSVKITYHDEKAMLRLICDNDTLETIQFQVPNNTRFDYINIIIDCPAPSSYADALRNLKINPDVIAELWIRVKSPTPQKLRDDQFVGFKLRVLTIEMRQYRSLNAIRYYYEHKLGSSGKIDLAKGTRLVLDCESELDLPPVTPIEFASFKRLQISRCLPLGTSYFEALQALNISTDSEEMRLSFRDNSLKLPNTLLARLSIKKLSIFNFYEHAVHFEENFFEPILSTLEELDIRRVDLPRLPATSRLQKVTLNTGFSSSTFGGCSMLKSLVVIKWQFSDEEGNWLSNCTQLRELVLKQMPEQTLQRMLTGVGMITNLTISRCALTHISDKLLVDAVGLEHLVLSELKLSEMHSRAFSFQSNLKTLDLAGNGLSLFWNLNEMFRSLPQLRMLSLADNPDVGFCLRYRFETEHEMKSPPLLQHLSLQGTGLDELCFSEWDSLTNLDLSSNKIDELQFDNLPLPRNGNLEIDLTNNPIYYLPETETDYGMIVQRYQQVYNLTIIWMSLKLDCDCKHAWFARTLRSLPQLQIDGADCSNGDPLESSPPELLECDKYPYAGCIYRRSWRNQTTIGDCQGSGLTSIPNLKYVQNIEKLLAANNHIDKLNVQDFPDSLVMVDLRANSISSISSEVLSVIFSVPERNISLGGNPFVCNCENQDLIATLQSFQKQVTDFDNVTCVGDGVEVYPVRNVDIDILCFAIQERKLLVSATTGGTLLTLITLAAVLVYRYWKEIKIYLFARGWCLCCVTEEEVDGDRQYDAFIAFSHGDEEFVVEKLLPWLNSHPELRYCMHTRDWMPGEPILTHVVRSVQQSKRTIILLSRNFVKSVWGMLEFRTAHVSALREGRARVIVIVLDDVISDGIVDQELQSYLRTNTYLNWGAPRFWERLRYALPHRGSADRSQNMSDSTNPGGPINGDPLVSRG